MSAEAAGSSLSRRLFIAATEQNTGKTTTSLGLYSVLRHHFPRIGFIKPVGQRFMEVDGKQIDEDSILIRDTFGTQTPIEDMSPIAVEPTFTRRYINQANNEALIKRVKNSFERAAWEKDFTIIEGTGHAGVGSVFDLSNAKVARILRSKVLLITPSGIGRPIDEGALNKALFDQEDVEIIGVVMNKALPEKIDSITDIARRGFERLGLELLGVLPRETILMQPGLQQVCEKIGGAFLHGQDDLSRRVAHVMIGAVSSAHLFREVKQDTLLVVPGDREDVILAALSRACEEDGGPFAGIVLSDDLKPSERLLELMAETPLAVIVSQRDSYYIASRIHSLTVKTLPGDTDKIGRIQDMVSRHIDVTRILEKLS